MILHFHDTDLYYIQTYPLPFWNNDVRGVLDQVLAGSPAVETDDNGSPTGWYSMSDPEITYQEEFILLVLRTQWALAADTIGLGVEYTITELVVHIALNSREAHLQGMADAYWADWDGLVEDMEEGSETPATAETRIWDYMVAQGAALGLTPNYPDDAPS